MNNRIIRIGIFVCEFLLVFSLMLTGCQNQSSIGEIVFRAPVTAVLYEMGEDKGEKATGIVYREVYDINKVIASYEVVLIAFLGDNASLGTAVSFIETISDRFMSDLLVIRVNSDAGENDPQLVEIATLLNVESYPYFALIHNAKIQFEFTEYNSDTEEQIIEAIYTLIA